ncbi:MAG: DUF5916 domain-containing protein [Acidobacteria bacterium]|nr:DUF5916 domain-containing protein [Acidobacteriota bacterium]
MRDRGLSRFARYRLVPAALALALAGAALPGVAAGQPAGGALGAGEREAAAGLPLTRAWRVSTPPAIDGDVLNDPAWADATPATGFRQNTPDEGAPASERTEVYVIYTDDTLYFGVVCYVRDPSTIIVADSRRDSSLRETDSFQIILDTFHDRQNGFVFGTNPAGVEYDGQVTNEGQGSGRSGGFVVRSGSGQQRGSGGGFNLNWDGVWEVDAQVSDVGWTAELAIPFRTLRYPSGEAQMWGVNFQRNIRHRNEQSYWAPLPRQFDLNRLSLAGELQGLAVPQQRNLKLTPFAVGSWRGGREAERPDFGADLKYSVTPGLTLDATYNTDFAQVEVDDQQINLDRFNLFFPEKRPFFLENAGLFSVGQPGQLEIFFSRRIGIGDGGEQIPITGGGRLSGKVGNNTNVGFLNMQTDAVSGARANNFTVARLRQDFVNRSNVGVMLVNRTGTGPGGGGDYNRSYAADGRLGIGQEVTLSGFVAGTDTPDVASETHAYSGQASYDSERYRLGAGFTEVAPNFNPEVGFYARRGYRRMDARFRTAFRPRNSWGFHEFTPHVTHYTILDYTTGQHETQYTHMDSTIEWRNGSRLATAWNVTKEGVLRPFEIYPGIDVPIDTYSHSEGQFRFNTNRGAPVSFEFRAVAGGFFGGRRRQVGPQVSVRLGETFNAQLAWDRNDITLPNGPFVTNLVRTRVNYSFSTRMFVQALVQRNDRDRLWSSNIRFGLLSAANTGLFVVYNDIRFFDHYDLFDRHLAQYSGAGRSLSVKYSQVFDVLQ